jgi:hypothetical protein
MLWHFLVLSTAGEVLVAAMELQGNLNPALCNDSITMSALVGAGSWSTILADASITFSDKHQAEGSWVILQYDYDQSTSIVTSTDIVYPMPAWDDRTVTDDGDDDAADDDGDDDVGTNSGGGSEDDDVLTRGSDAAVAAAVLCGLIVLLLLIVIVKLFFLAPTAAPKQADSSGTELSSTKNAMKSQA